MNYKYIFFVFIIFNFCYEKVDSACISSEVSCNNHGTCENGQCLCDYFWQGSECEIEWKNVYTGWLAYFFFMCYLDITLMSMVSVYSIYLLVIFEKISRRTGKSRWTITLFVTIPILIGALIRIVYYSIDPHRIFGIYSPATDGILFALPLIIWIAAGDLMMLYWIELTQLSGLQTLRSIKKLKPVFVALVIATLVTVLPIAVWESIEQNTISIAFYNGILLIYVLIMVVLSMTYGIKLMKNIKSLWHSTKNQATKIFLNKITIFLLWCTTFEILIMLSLILYTIIGAGQIPFAYVTFHLIYRIEEFGTVSFMLMLVSRKKARKRYILKRKFKNTK